jgi:hypothetical protein
MKPRKRSEKTANYPRISLMLLVSFWLVLTAPQIGMAGDKNVFLVPVPEDSVSWYEFAYLAAIPASQKISGDKPSVIAMDASEVISEEIQDYLDRYSPESIYILGNSSSPDPDIIAESAQQMAYTLAGMFWVTVDRIVLCDDQDYENALVASGVAGRLQVPLFYFDQSGGLSAESLTVIGNLSPTSALLLGDNSTVVTQLSGEGVSTTLLADAYDSLQWMVNNNLPVDYFAYANPDDRDMSGIIVKKQSIAAPLLAVGREGAVIPFGFETRWNIPFYHSGQTTTRPSGAPSGDKWLTGSMTPVTSTYDFIITVDVDAEENENWIYCNIDFNNDGDYGDPGEGPFVEAGNEVEFDGTWFQMVMGLEGRHNDPGDIKLKYPCASDMVDELSSYFAVMAGQPEHLCIVGLFDVIPFGTNKYWGGGIDCGVNDGDISNVDDDVWYELATGRVFGENMSFGTLLAARSVTYDDLVSPEWADKSLLMGGGSLNFTRFCGKYLENVGFEPAHEIDREFGHENLPYMQNRSAISHSWHSLEVSWGWGPNYFDPALEKPNLDNIFLAPCVADSGGCLVAGIDLDYYSWDRIIAPKFLRRGAVAYIGSTRTASNGYETPKTAMWNALAAGKTLGQAWKQAQNTHKYTVEAGMGGSDEGNIFAFYGDPGLRMYLPSEPIVEPAHLEQSGSILTAVAPPFTVDTYEDTYTFYGPGTYTEGWSEANYLAKWTTDAQITNLTELVQCPGSLGWPGSNDWFIDEHWDGTRSIYWRVRFLDQASDYSPAITAQLDEISYQVTGVTPGDINLDGKVDLADFSRLAQEWMSTNCQSSQWCQGADIDESGQVGLTDLTVIADHWLNNTFTDQTGLPRVINLVAGNITSYAATLNGQVIYNGGDDPTVDIYWGAGDGGTTPGIWDHQINLGTQGVGTFYADISGLDQDTTYYSRCYASNSFGSDWANTTAKFTVEPFPPVPVIESQSTDWHYRKGTSQPPSDWREIGFTEDGTWLIGQTSIGFGDGDDNTFLDDMQYNYTTVYLRHAFEIGPGEGIPDTLTLRIYVDDGCIISINGQEVDRIRVSDGDKSYNDVGQWTGDAQWEESELTNASAYLTVGTNILAIHALNTSLDSSDFSIDVELSRPPLSMEEYLEGHWELDESSGTVASDSVGGHDGTLMGDPTWRPSDGQIGGALEFDGDGDYVEVAGYKGISGSNARTVTAWVKVESNGSGLSIVRWGTMGINGGLWSNVINADGNLRAAVIGGSVVGDTVIDDDTWHHVAIVLPDKENVKVEDILLYVDGEQEDTTATNGDQTIDTAIGMDVLISLDGSDGLLDDVRIYNYMLRKDDIQALANTD